MDPLGARLIDELFELSSTTGDDAGMVVDALMILGLFGGGIGPGSFTVTGGASAISAGSCSARSRHHPCGLDLARGGHPVRSVVDDRRPTTTRSS